MNYNDICILDFESAGRNVYDTEEKLGCEPTQLSALILNPRTLKIKSVFNANMRPLRPDDIEQEALDVTKKTKEEVLSYRHPKEVWEDFTKFIKNSLYEDKPFNYPILAGYNIDSFDAIIINRLCNTYGPTRKDKFSGQTVQGLFNTFVTIDLMKIIWLLMENSNCLKQFSEQNKHDIKQTTVARWMGLKTDMAHDALYDVKLCATMLVKFIKMNRTLLGDGLTTGRAKFHNSLASEQMECLV